MMFLIRAEGLVSSIAGFQTDLLVLLPGQTPWGVGLSLPRHISPAASAFCYHLWDTIQYLVESSPLPMKLNTTDIPILQRIKLRLTQVKSSVHTASW